MNEEREKIRYNPSRCPFCGKRNIPLFLDAEAYYKWANREICIQDAFPDLSPDQREIILTGICPECWDEHIGKVEEEADEDLVLENADPNETIDEIEEQEAKKKEAFETWKEMLGMREDYDWDIRDLEQRAKDLELLEKIEEQTRQLDALDKIFETQKKIDKLNELESLWEEEYCSDPVNDSLFGSF